MSLECTSQVTYVDVGGQILPNTLNSLNNSLTTQDTLCSYFQRDSSDFRSESRQLPDHSIYSLGCQLGLSEGLIEKAYILQDSHFSLRFDLDHFAQITLTC